MNTTLSIKRFTSKEKNLKNGRDLSQFFNEMVQCYFCIMDPNLLKPINVEYSQQKQRARPNLLTPVYNLLLNLFHLVTVLLIIHLIIVFARMMRTVMITQKHKIRI